jgi:3-phosphoshikimate 1-carboxyvinyltransferase
VKLCNIAKVAMSSTVKIKGRTQVGGDVEMPGDKSISHRIALLAAIAEGASTIHHFATSADCHATIDCMQKLGVELEHDRSKLIIHGTGPNLPCPTSRFAALYAANSGSTMRMLPGILAAQGFKSELDGDESLLRRPMRRIIQPLRLMGASITASEDNYAPLIISGGPLRAIRYESPVASAQVKSCLLLAGLFAGGRTEVLEPAASRNHTELMLKELGALIEFDPDEPAVEFGTRADLNPKQARSVSIEPGGHLKALEYTVPGDVSSAAFFVAAAAVTGSAQMVIRGVGLNPTRTAFLGVLRDLGVSIKVEGRTIRHGEPVGDLVVSATELSSGGEALISGAIIPNIIDEIPILAVVASQVRGRVVVRGASELRIKESDRIRSIVSGLRALGAEVEEFEDGFAIDGPQRLAGGVIDSAGDHRIAMAFAVAGLVADGTTQILGAECAAVSFPDFYDLLNIVSGGAVIMNEN